MTIKHTSRRGFLRAMATGAAGLGLSACASLRPRQKRRPNFLLIIGDDISVDDFGCYGHPHIRTPNVDALAQDGVRFTNAYLVTSQCSPTRCSLLSGRYPHNHGAPELHQGLPKGQPMFPLMLKEAGYYTVSAGKLHAGGHAKTAFDTVVTSKPGGEEKWIECLRERPKDKPFFMWLAAIDAHRGWTPDKEGQEHQESDATIPPYMADMPGTREDLAKYYNEIQRFDRYIGQVVEELKRQDEYENTVIMFMADNGRPFPRCKTWLYDSGIKMPFIVHWPAGIKKAAITDSLMSAIDIAPTIIELAGLEKPEAFQGVSFTPLLRKPKVKIRDYCFAEHNWHDTEAHERMVRWDNFVYIRTARPHLANWVHAHRQTLAYKDLFALKAEGKLTPAQDDVFLAPRPVEMLFDVEKD